MEAVEATATVNCDDDDDDEVQVVEPTDETGKSPEGSRSEPRRGKKRKSDEAGNAEGMEDSANSTKWENEGPNNMYASDTCNMNLGPFDRDFHDLCLDWIADLGRVFTSLSYHGGRIARQELKEQKEEVADWEISDWKSGWALVPKQREEIYVSPTDPRFPIGMVTSIVDLYASTNASVRGHMNVVDSGCIYRILEWVISRLLVRYSSVNRLPSTTDITAFAHKIIDAGGDNIMFKVLHERTHLVLRRQHKSAHSVEYRVPTVHNILRQSDRLRRLLLGSKDVTPKLAVGVDKNGPYMVLLDTTLFLVRFFPQVAEKLHPEKYFLHLSATPMPFRFCPQYSLR